MKNVLLGLMFLGLGTAYGATSYRVDLYRPTVVNGTELKAGECKIEIHDNRIVLKQGKVSAEAAIKVENNPRKFPSTTVGYAGEGSGNELQEIRLGGTTTKVVFEQGSAALSGGSK